jgi:hypothetical protein
MVLVEGAAAGFSNKREIGNGNVSCKIHGSGDC